MEQIVRVIRKQKLHYVSEEINTAILLPGSQMSAEENRRNTINRLRQDPAVIFILDTDKSPCEEKVSLAEGFAMAVTLDEWSNPVASIRITLHEDVVYEREYEWQEEEEYEDCIEDFLSDCIWILDCIDRKTYYFLADNHPLYPRHEVIKPADLFDIERMLVEGGFQTERILTVNETQVNPLLFIHENDVVMVGSRHFTGKNIFVELKRFFDTLSLSSIEKAVEKVREVYHPSILDIIYWPDKSWSFRMSIESGISTENILSHVMECITTLREVIQRIQLELQYYPSDSYSMFSTRQYFIYEVIDASIKQSRILI